MFQKLLANSIVKYVVDKLGPVPGAIAQHLNVSELVRIAVTAAIMGGGGFAAVLPALVANVASFVTTQDVALVVAGLTFVSEAYRRFGHGDPLPAK